MKRFQFPESMKLASIWVIWGFLSLGILGWGLHVILASVGRLEDMAAWVQAVGSIGAIVAAIWVVSAQGRQNLDLVKRHEAEALKKVISVAKYSNNVNQMTVEVLLGALVDDDLRLAELGLKRASALLSEISYNSIPESSAAIGWIELRFATSKLAELVERALTDDGFDDSEALEARPLGAYSQEATVRIRDASVGHLPELNDPR